MLTRLSILFLVIVSLPTSAYAQTTCTASAIVPPLDGNSTSEVVGDVLLTCESPGGTGAQPVVQSQTLTVELNTDVVNPESSGVTNAVLVVNQNHCDSPSPTGGAYGTCGTSDPRFQDPQFGVKTTSNRLQWSFDFPTPGADPDGVGPVEAFPQVTTVRIRLVRSNVSQIGVQDAPLSITATYSLVGDTFVAIDKGDELTVGVAVEDPRVVNPLAKTGVGAISCFATAVTAAVDAVPPDVGLDGRVGDIFLDCQRIPHGLPNLINVVPIDLTLSLNVNVTSPELAELVILNNHCRGGMSAQTGGVFGQCGAPNQAVQDPQIPVFSEPNKLTWEGILLPIPAVDDPEGGFPGFLFPVVTTMRLRGLHANVVQLGVPNSSSFPPVQVSAFITTQHVLLTNNFLNIGAPIAGTPPTHPEPPTTPRFTCVAHAVAPIVRSSGLTEITADLVLSCISPPHETPTTQTSVVVDLTTSYNANVTNNLDFGAGASVTDSVLIVNENNCESPSPTGSRFGGCGAQSEDVQDPQFGVLAAHNRLEWKNLTLPVPAADGDGPLPPNPVITTVRITSVATNASAFGVPDAVEFPMAQITAFMTVNPPWSVAMNNNVLNAGVPFRGLAVDPMPAALRGKPGRAEMTQTDLCPGTEHRSGLTIRQGIGTAFRTIGEASISPGRFPFNNTSFTRESGYFAPGSNLGGGVSHATRFLVRFSGVPSDVKVEVPLTVDIGDAAI